MAEGEARERGAEQRSEESGDRDTAQTEVYDPTERPGDDRAESDVTSEKDRDQQRRRQDTPDEEETREPQKTEAREEQRDEDGDEEQKPGPPTPFRAFLLFVATIAFLIIGLLLFSAVIAPTYIVALILAAAWFVGAYFLLGRFTRNRRHLRFPIRIAFGSTVLAILLWVGINSVNGKTVHEQLVTGQKISKAQPTARIPEKPAKPTPPQNRLLSTGAFKSAGAGSVAGQASYIQLKNDTVMVTIKGLDVMSAPTLHVFLAKADGKDVSAHKDLGSLKGNKGDMQYVIPKGTDPRQYKTVVIWNKAFGVPFARAETKLQ
jgi:Electron transfer DM13